MAQRDTELRELEKQAAAPDLWENPQAAQQLHAEMGRRKRGLEPMRKLLSKAEDLATLAQLAEEESSDGESAEIEADLVEVHADPGFKERLRRSLWDLVQTSAGQRPIEPPPDDN